MPDFRAIDVAYVDAKSLLVSALRKLSVNLGARATPNAIGSADLCHLFSFRGLSVQGTRSEA